MNKKGFTLVELLGVIILLGVIALITTNAVLPMITQSKTDVYNNSVKSIERAAQTYVVENDITLPTVNGTSIDINITLLASYVQHMEDPRDKSLITGIVRVTKQANEYIYLFIRHLNE